METGHSDAYLIALANCPVFGFATLQILAAHFADNQTAWNATREELLSLNLPEHRADDFIAYRNSTDPHAVVELLEKHSIITITKDHPHYPPLLKTIFDPPYLLFAKGDTSILTKKCVAMVGSRRLTDYGKTVAFNFAKRIAEEGIVIVSGLAEGIDSAAHTGALEGGLTAAILGCGLLHRQSRTQEELKEHILLKGGVIVSEFPLKAPGLKFHFPLRNRIVAGMSEASAIIEADLPSGSLITAKASLEAGREVFALPGPINSATSRGTNWLLKEGAHVLTEPEDILSLLGVERADRGTGRMANTYEPKNELESKILMILEKGERHIDDIITESLETPAVIGSALMTLEIEGAVKNRGGMRYALGG